MLGSAMVQAIQIVFVGRGDSQKRFAAFQMIAHRLSEYGHKVELFESDRQRESAELDRKLEAIWPGLNGRNGPSHPAYLRAIRIIAKFALVLMSRKRMLFLPALVLPKPFVLAQELQTHVTKLAAQRVVLIGHSAGAIAAAKASRHPKVAGILCLGYPFRHPDRAPEPYRTNFLAKVTKPMLIVQGDRDEYGSDPALFGPFLPPDCQVLTVPCGHNYNDLSDADLDKVLVYLKGMAQR